MEQQKLSIGGVPAVLYGRASEQVYLFVHGRCGCKEEAKSFHLTTGETVLGIDLPAHGERRGAEQELQPWLAVPDITAAYNYLNERFEKVLLRANSIGAWLSLVALEDESLEKALLVSPVLDMEGLISGMMHAANVSEERLKAEKIIPTEFGQDLSWKYLCFAREHPIKRCPPQTEILYAGGDNLTGRKTVDGFVHRFGCGLTVMENGEHWFHTPEQLEVLGEWERKYC